MGIVTFKTNFSGGIGDLFITSDETGQKLHFTQASGPTTLNLHMGHHILGVDGAAPSGPGGGITLEMTGDLPSVKREKFPAGNIPPHNIVLYVTK